MTTATVDLSTNNLMPSPLEVDSLAPYFSGIDQNGDFQSLDRLSKEGPFVILFYNGGWCNYCIDQILEFQKGIDNLSGQGFPVVLITPEKKEYINETIENTNVTFPIIHDNLNYIMTNYNVAIKPPVSFSEKIDLKERNNSSNPLLPLPATYIVGRDGMIKHGHFSLDFAMRSSFSEISSKVNELKG